jgi:hypothetical protein
MPYQPTVTNRTGEFLFRGITGAADSLADAVKQRKQQSQKASSLRKTIGIYNPELKDEVQTMGLADLEGYVAGIGMKAAKDKLAQDQSNKDREYNLSKVYADLQQGQMNRANERDAAGQRFTQSLASLMGTGGGPSMDFANTLAGEPQPARDVGLADIVQAAGQSGLTLEPTSLAQLLRAEQMGQRGNAGAELAFQEDPVTGARVATFGNSLIPTGTNPAKQQAQAVAVTDSEGNVIGQAIPGRNGMQLVRTPAKGVDPKTRVNAILAQLKVESNLPRRQKLTEELDGLLNGTAPAAAPTATGAVNDPLGLFN